MTEEDEEWMNAPLGSLGAVGSEVEAKCPTCGSAMAESGCYWIVPGRSVHCMLEGSTWIVGPGAGGE